VKYILIMMLAFSSTVAITTAEFNNRDACLSAARTFTERSKAMGYHPRAICAQKGMDNARQ
jgi:hypothetical protein